MNDLARIPGLPSAPRPAGLEAHRGPEYSALGDDMALAIWLAAQTSPQTQRSYRTQSAKFRLFLQLIHPEWPSNQHLRLAKQKDVEDYEKALSFKNLNEATRRVADLSPDELTLFGLSEQPFAKRLAPSSVNQALTILNAMYSFFQEPNESMPDAYVRFNPVKTVRKRTKQTIKKTDRLIPIEGIQAMHSMLLGLIGEANSARRVKEIARYERALWMFTLLFGLWGRREEIAQLSMGDFKQLSTGEWMVSLTRKGRTTAEEIPGPAWVIDGLRRYRESIGLTRAWAPADPRPAIASLRTRPGLVTNDHIHSQAIYLEIKHVAEKTALAIEAGQLMPEMDGAARERLCAILRSCSPHWFRHTGPTIAINSQTLTITQASQILGHTSIDTTSQMYYHGDVNAMRDGLNAMGDMLSGKNQGK